jgi:hypothetical protein
MRDNFVPNVVEGLQGFLLQVFLNLLEGEPKTPAENCWLMRISIRRTLGRLPT